MQLSRALASEYSSDEVTVIAVGSKTSTGELEVRIHPGGKLVHSKLKVRAAGGERWLRVACHATRGK